MPLQVANPSPKTTLARRPQSLRPRPARQHPASPCTALRFGPQTNPWPAGQWPGGIPAALPPYLGTPKGVRKSAPYVEVPPDPAAHEGRLSILARPCRALLRPPIRAADNSRRPADCPATAGQHRRAAADPQRPAPPRKACRQAGPAGPSPGTSAGDYRVVFNRRAWRKRSRMKRSGT